MPLEWFNQVTLQRRDRLFWRVIGAAACVCAFAVVADTVRLAVHFFQPLFIWDSWETVKDFKSFEDGTYRLSDLFAQHNEHRIAVPRLVFFADFVVGRGLNVVNIVAIFLIQAVHAGLLIAMASRVCRGAILAVVSAAIFVLLFSFGQTDNLTSGFQVQFVGVYAAATAACLAAAIAMQRDASPLLSVTAMAGAMLAATAATYSMSNGLLSPLILVGLAVLKRARKPLLIAAIVFAAAILFAYAHGAHFSGGAPPLTASPMQRLLAVSGYFLIYIGGVAGAAGLVAAGVFGFVIVTLSLVAGWRLIQGQDTDTVDAALVGIMAFVLATGAVTAWGRVGFGLPQALESRYVTPSAVLCAVILVYWGSSRRASRTLLSQVLLFVLVVTTMAAGVGRHIAQRPWAQWNFMSANLGTDALLSGVFAPKVLETIYPHPSTVENLVPFLARKKLNVFALPEASWRGKHLAEVFPAIDDERCSVVLDKQTRLDTKGDVAVEGWAWDKRRRKPVARIVLVDPDQTIVGLGSGDWFRPDFRTLPGVENAEPGWRGFAISAEPSAIRPYAVLDGGKIVCGGR